jgi:hypothetical protein
MMIQGLIDCGKTGTVECVLCSFLLVEKAACMLLNLNSYACATMQ